MPLLEVPLAEYRARLSARSSSRARLDRYDERLSHARMAIVIIVALLAWLVFRRELSAVWFGIPIAVFLGLAIWHERVIRRRDACARAADFYQRGIARIEDRWAGTGEPGLRFLKEDHLYAQDLDLFGTGSLFELLSTARTRAGEDTLAAWISAPSPVAEVRPRQQAVDELRNRLDFREALALAGASVSSVDTAPLISWASMPTPAFRLWTRVLAWVLPAAAIGTASLALSGFVAPFLAVIAVEMLLMRVFRPRVQQAVHGVEEPARDLEVLALALVLIEKEEAGSERLRSLRQGLTAHGVSASAAITRLHRLAELHDWQHNQLFAPVAFVLLWSLHLTFAIEAWRREFGPRVADWVRTVGEYEALISLATYAYEHPADPFPTFIEEGPATVDGVGLGHPLVPSAQMVPNDLRLGDEVRLLIVSGSNMSGKSTLLRTVGINAVLALAGAPVRATRLELAFLKIGATLRIQDSLRAGRSRFYAEIARIRELADVAKGPTPLLFLLDELFQGTNSGDRAAGAAAVLRLLVDRGAIGLVTTHDLALTALADKLNGRAANVHFEDLFENGELRFDYRLRPGPATHGNALALLRMVGLAAPD